MERERQREIKTRIKSIAQRTDYFQVYDTVSRSLNRLCAKITYWKALMQVSGMLSFL